MIALAFFQTKLFAQDPTGEVSRYEMSVGWLGVTPRGNVLTNSNRVDFVSDLGINRMHSQFDFRAQVMPWTRSGLLVEFIPYRFDGEVTTTRSFRFGGVTYPANERVSAKASMNFLLIAYRRNLIDRERFNLGLLAGGAYLGIRARAENQTVGSSEINRDIPFPLIGLTARYSPAAEPRLSFRGETRGMTFGSYGGYIDARGAIGFKLSRHISLDAGYFVVDGDGHHETRGAQLNFHGPTLTLRLHDE